MKFRRWLLVVLIGWLIFLVGGDLNTELTLANENKIKVIPTLFGQTKEKSDWFVYHGKPGQDLSIPLTIVNLTNEKIIGYLNLRSSVVFSSSETKFQLPANDRIDLNFKVHLASTISNKEYHPLIAFYRNNGNLLTELPITVRVGEHLKGDFKIEGVEIRPKSNFLQVSFKIKNTGQVSLEDIEVTLKYKNNWWLGLSKEEKFSLSKQVLPQQTLVVNHQTDLPSGFIGPINFKLKVANQLKTLSLDKNFFWFSLRRLFVSLGYGLIFLIALLLSFKFVFKGVAGIIFNYIKEKASRERKQQEKSTSDRLPNLLSHKPANINYSQLLLDIRQIVREEVELHRRLFLAENEKIASRILLNLIEKGQLKLVSEQSKKKTRKKN